MTESKPWPGENDPRPEPVHLENIVAAREFMRDKSSPLSEKNMGNKRDKDFRAKNGSVKIALTSDSDGRIACVYYFPDVHANGFGLSILSRDPGIIRSCEDCLDVDADSTDFRALADELDGTYGMTPYEVLDGLRTIKRESEK